MMLVLLLSIGFCGESIPDQSGANVATAQQQNLAYFQGVPIVRGMTFEHLRMVMGDSLSKSGTWTGPLRDTGSSRFRYKVWQLEFGDDGRLQFMIQYTVEEPGPRGSR